MYAWRRVLEIRLTSKKTKQTKIFGGEKSQFNINVAGYKYLSSLKDSCTFKISNLTAVELLEIQQQEYYKVEIVCGYKSSGSFTIFSGEIIYITQSLNSNRTVTANFLCASAFVAKYSQARLNLTLQSGLNMYAVLKYICNKAGIADSNVSPALKNKIVDEILNVNQTAGSFIESLTYLNDTYAATTDSASGSVISILDVSSIDASSIKKLDSKQINLDGGYPALDSDGVTFSMFPTFELHPGDVINLDNSLINLGGATKTNYNAMYFDEDGNYFITEMDYTLQNRGSEFSVSVKAKSYNTYKSV